jgi:hypothetical protein
VDECKPLIGGGGGGGGVLDSHAADVAAAHLASRGRSDLVGAPFDQLPAGACTRPLFGLT